MNNILSLAERVRNGELRSLAKAITLVESYKAGDRSSADKLVSELLPYSGCSIRIGISGIPGVGKSTFIESFGMYLVNLGYRIAVLAIDPSSQQSGGAILGDKTRMEKLAGQSNVFIRPSPSRGALGGVACRTREAILLCEAAGYNIVIVETVGTGQSEISVSSMVDFFLLMKIPGTGDELQGIKRGVMEVADGIVINKADGENLVSANLARQQIENALRILAPRSAQWHVPVLLCSALKEEGLDSVWEMIKDYVDLMKSSGDFSIKRQSQSVDWMWAVVYESIRDIFVNDPHISLQMQTIKSAVLEGQMSAHSAANKLMSIIQSD